MRKRPGNEVFGGNMNYYCITLKHPWDSAVMVYELFSILRVSQLNIKRGV